MEPRKRILLDKLADPEAIPTDPSPDAADLRREVEITAALADMHVKAGLEPPRERMLAGAIERTQTNRENNMNPIIRLLSGRPWPARLAILAGVLLAITMVAQLPAGTSYAHSAGRAIVFDLGVATSPGDEVRKREKWEAQSRRILDRFRAIGDSTHRIVMMSDPLSDNLRSLSGVIFVLDEVSDEESAAARRARERFAEYGGGEEIEVRVRELKREIEILAGGADAQSRRELGRAKEELDRARKLMAEVKLQREDRLDSASERIEQCIRLIEESHADEKQLREVKVLLEKINREGGGLLELHPDMEVLQREIERISVADHEKLILELTDQLNEELTVLDHLDIKALVEQTLAEYEGTEIDRAELMRELELELAEIDMEEISLEIEQGMLELEEGLLEMDLELEEALSGLQSLEGLRELTMQELRLDEATLLELQEGLLSVELQDLEALDLDLRELELEPLHIELQELDRTLELDLLPELEEMRLELQSLEELDLGNMVLELQQLDELKDIMIELELPEGELLELTMLEELHEAQAADKLSFRFKDHLFSFPRNTPAKKMAAIVNEWLQEHGHDTRVKVELKLDEDGEVVAAKAVVKE